MRFQLLINEVLRALIVTIQQILKIFEFFWELQKRI